MQLGQCGHRPASDFGPIMRLTDLCGSAILSGMTSFHDMHGTQTYTGWCEVHGKQLFTRKQAKRAKRAMHDSNLREDRCELVEGLWHLGPKPRQAEDVAPPRYRGQ